PAGPTVFLVWPPPRPPVVSHGPARGGGPPPPPADVDGSDHALEVERSGAFGPTEFRRHERDLTYTTSEYLELLQTYSGHRALPETARNGLLECVASLIDGRYGGRVVKRCLIELAVSRRR
ncbi:hypothetical protein ABTX35_39745, partial [Streptomyces sp. NPDC096080]